MRDALRGLTGRGRGLLAIGVLVAVGAWVFGQRDLLRVAVLLLALPLLSAVLVARTRYRLGCARSVDATRIGVGEATTARVTVQNVSRLPSGLLLVSDDVPPALGTAPRVALDRVEPQGTREISYPLAGRQRGRFAVGPLSVRLVDPFGLVGLTRSFRGTDLVLVTPVVHRLPTIPLGGDWTGAGESRSRAVASSGEDDVVPRAYRIGDELRRVHWRATARYGELMARREEQPWRSRATVIVDTRATAHRGAGASSSLEWALSAAASIGTHLLHRGWSVRLVDGDGVPIAGEGDAGADSEGLLLDALAVLQPSPSHHLRVADPASRRAVTDGLLVAVMGAMDVEQAQGLSRVRPGSGTGLALVLDVAAWARPGEAVGRHPESATAALYSFAPGSQAPARAAAAGPAGPAAALLTQAGWRAAIADPAQPLAALWPLLARGAGLGGGSLRPGAAGRSPAAPVGGLHPGGGIHPGGGVHPGGGARTVGGARP